MSNPHFYHRSGEWADYLEGFNPQKDDHESFITIEPTMAVPFDQCARSQSNLVVEKLSGYPKELVKFSEKIVPLFWVEYVRKTNYSKTRMDLKVIFFSLQCQRSLTPPIVFTIKFVVNILPTLQYFIIGFFICFGLITTTVSAFWIMNSGKSPKNLLFLRANSALERENVLRNKEVIKQSES
jgi:hypothetical protein